jgi:response regulator of citrate/malate metabolism
MILMSEESLESLKKIVELLQEILRWIKFAGAREVRTVLGNMLDTEQKRLIYHLSDGEHGSVEISKTVGVSDVTVRRYWESWARLGIMEPLRVRGGVRYKKCFELEDFGFTVPQIKESVRNESNQ